MRIYSTLIVPVVALTFTLASCGGETKSEKGEVTVEENKFDSEDQEFILPQPITMAQMFKEAGLTYVSGKANPASNKSKYGQKIDQLLNLGVYSTDLAYCAINDKTQEAREYLVSIQYLGSKVGLESVFSDKALIDKFDKNLGNPEALEELIYDIQDKSDVYLDDNDMRYLAAIQFAGSWAEGVYLGIDDSRKKGGDLGIAIVEQMTLLQNTIKGLKSHPAKDDKRLNEVVAKFEDVLNTYNGFASVKAANANKNFKAPALSSEEFETLATKITALRNNIVTPSK